MAKAKDKPKAPKRKPLAEAARPGAGKKAKTKPGSSTAKSTSPAEGNQIGTIMSKGLDLAEAGLTLGLNLVERFGSTVQDEVIGRIAEARKSFAHQASTPRPSSPGGVAADEPRPDEGAPAPAAPSGTGFGGVSNRLPLFPGSPVRVPFSINNESADVAKQVNVRLEGLVGELSGERLDASHFPLVPPATSIAPMDFEKFTLTGVVPRGVRADAYSGWIIVSGEEQLRIPVKLVITGQS